jgi:hypothetical protein
MLAQQDSDGVIAVVPHSPSASISRDTWRAGADALRRHQLGELAAMLLDALAPLALVASQLLYAGRPFLGIGALRLASFLESEQEVSNLSRYLATGSGDRSPAPRPERD